MSSTHHFNFKKRTQLRKNQIQLSSTSRVCIIDSKEKGCSSFRPIVCWGTNLKHGNTLPTSNNLETQFKHKNFFKHILCCISHLNKLCCISHLNNLIEKQKQCTHYALMFHLNIRIQKQKQCTHYAYFHLNKKF